MLGNRTLDGLGPRALLLAWFAACVVVLVFAYLHPGAEASILFGMLMLSLTFPLGYVLATIVGFISSVLYNRFGVYAPDSFVVNLMAWTLLVVAGYIQWFILLPWAWRKFRGA